MRWHRSAWFMIAVAVAVCGLSGRESSGQESSGQELEQKFLADGVTRKVGGYRPNREVMDGSAELVKTAPEGLVAPRYGEITIGDQSWTFLLDEPEDQPARLWIDTNGDADLTNDPETKWEPQTRDELTMYQGTGQIRLPDGNVGSLGLYRFDPKDEKREALKETLMFYLDYGYEYSFELDGKPFSTFVAGALEPDSALPVDRDGNGEISNNFEMVKLGEPFNFTGTTVVLALRENRLVMEKAAAELPQLQLPPDLKVGNPALPFTAETMTGEKVRFPEDYAGKIVMLDFWATWCGPCIGEVPHMKQAWEDWHEEGFEILGVSFDQPDEEEKIREFLAEKELPWKQIYEGKGWDTSLGKQYDVSGIPFVLLVDGDTGEILANARQLRGKGLSALIGEKLKARKEQAGR